MYVIREGGGLAGAWHIVLRDLVVKTILFKVVILGVVVFVPLAWAALILI